MQHSVSGGQWKDIPGEACCLAYHGMGHMLEDEQEGHAKEQTGSAADNQPHSGMPEEVGHIKGLLLSAQLHQLAALIGAVARVGKVVQVERMLELPTPAPVTPLLPRREVWSEETGLVFWKLFTRGDESSSAASRAR